MITIVAVAEGLDFPAYLSVQTDDDYHANLSVPDWLDAIDYYRGKSPPNFPVPSIRRRVVMHVDNNGMCHAVSVGNRFYPRK